MIVAPASAVLAGAFVEFSEAAARLEGSYRQLQDEVTQLRAILAERNQALHNTRTENSQIKVALRQILDSLPCGVLVVTGDRQVSLSNPEARRLLGVTEKQIINLQGKDSPGIAALEEFLKSSPPNPCETEVCLSAKAGKRWLAIRACRLAVPGPSSPSQTIVILRDTTSQKNLEEQRESARNVVALAEVSAVLAHEIRNPLASLELFAGLLGEPGNDMQTCASHLRAGIRFLSATVNNVLCFHSDAVLRQTPLHLAEVLRRAVEFVRPLAEQRRIEVSLTVSSGDLTIFGDPDSLHQLFLNLALNAFRHTDTGGWLRIRASRNESDCGPQARVEFSDNGSGISPEVLPYIFQAGFSGNGQTPGLGLAVCRRIVEQHGGRIAVQSEVGRGTTFSLDFPIEP